MAAQDIIALVSATIATFSLCVALLQYLELRRNKRTQGEELAQQRERLRLALSGVVSGAETANLIVQRAKESAVTKAELQSVARALRQTMLLIAKQLASDEAILAKRVDELRTSIPRSRRKAQNP